MIDTGLFVREGFHQAEKGVEIEHVPSSLLTTLPQLSGWVKHVYRPHYFERIGCDFVIPRSSRIKHPAKVF